MPGANDYQIALFPGDNAVCVPCVPHVCQRLELATRFIKVTSRPQVGLGASDSTSRHVDASAHLDTLLVPQVEEHGGVVSLEVNTFIVLLAKGKHLFGAAYLELTLREV